MALLSGSRDLIIAVAGVFIVLPSFMYKLFIPVPEASKTNATLTQVLETMTKQYQEYFFPIVLLMLITTLGVLIILTLVLDKERPTVGASISLAAAALLTYIVANWINSLATVFGFMALIAPGLYLIGRLSLFGPVIVAERQKNPITALKRSWELTKDNGWSIAMMILIVLVVGIVVVFLTGMVASAVFGMVGFEMATHFVNAVLEAALTVVLILVYAAAFKQLTEQVDGSSNIFD